MCKIPFFVPKIGLKWANFPSSNSDDLEKSNQATKNNSQSDSNPGF